MEQKFLRKTTEDKVSIIIVTYNALDYVKKCLESVLANTDPMHEIIVVDNHSEAPTRNYVSSLNKYPNVKLILNEENRLWSPANNQGLKASAPDAKFCLLLNSDVEVFSPNWLWELQQPMHQYKNVGISGTQFNFLPIRPTYGAIDGCCFFIRKELLDEIGYLDENYPWNGAGAIFTYHAWVKGWYFYHVNNPDLLIHYGKRSRINNQIQLKNQKVNVFQIMKDLGLRPSYDPWAYLQYKLNMFDINRKLRHYLVPVSSD
jgi:GT2 family glycosyltransferase